MGWGRFQRTSKSRAGRSCLGGWWVNPLVARAERPTLRIADRLPRAPPWPGIKGEARRAAPVQGAYAAPLGPRSPFTPPGRAHCDGCQQNIGGRGCGIKCLNSALVRHLEIGRGPVFWRMVGQPARAERNDPPYGLLVFTGQHASDIFSKWREIFIRTFHLVP